MEYTHKKEEVKFLEEKISRITENHERYYLKLKEQ